MQSPTLRDALPMASRPLDIDTTSLNFTLPPNLEASEPPEARGLARDEVRLLVSRTSSDSVQHVTFRDLPQFLQEGDVVVLNTSATINAALPATRSDGTELEVHLSTQLPGGVWIVELRQPDKTATQPFLGAIPGESLALPAEGVLNIHTPYCADCGLHSPARAILTGVPQPEHTRLWIASLQLPTPLPVYLDQHGFPIRYKYVEQNWPLSAYQTVFATEPGSAEMPSAGRAFTPELITQLVARGVQVVPLLLHTGVASLEDHEPPYEEYYRVSATTAQSVNAARSSNRRVVAVGTTVVRALETVTDEFGITHPGEGWTRQIITPDYDLRAVTALLTGLHEPQASHLAMLTALSNPEHVALAYAEALRGGYLWHEFGDLHLLLQ